MDHEQIYDRVRDQWLLIDRAAGEVIRSDTRQFEDVPHYAKPPAKPPAKPQVAARKESK